VLAVRPYTHNDNYWQVYFATNKAIVETFGEAGYPVPTETVTQAGVAAPAPPRAATTAGTHVIEPTAPSGQTR
jgi:hypothetical protein